MSHARKQKISYVVELKSKGYLTEREILNVRMRLNKGKLTYDDASKLLGMKLTSEQTQKGLNWLKNKWKTPKGLERENNPFGSREEHIIDNFKEFRLHDLYNNTNAFQDELGIKNFVPVWLVKAKDGSTFQYYMEAGEPKIIG